MWVRGTVAMLAIERLIGVALRDESEESIADMGLITKAMIHRGFETQGRHDQKSKVRVSVFAQKGLMYFTILKKKSIVKSLKESSDYKR